MAEQVFPLKKLPAFFRHLYTMLVVCLGFVVFRGDTLSEGMKIIGSMFGFGAGTDVSSLLVQLTPLYLVTLVVAVIGSFPVAPWMKKRANGVMNFLSFGYSFVLLILCLLSLSSGTYNPFIYFRF